jgi:hypothetical protein
LISDGRKLMPNVTRVFKRNRDLYVYLQTYEQDLPEFHPLIAFLSLYHGEARALQTGAIEVPRGQANRLRTAPLTFNVALSKLPPGEYVCQVTVLDPTGQKGAFWRAALVLIQ